MILRLLFSIILIIFSTVSLKSENFQYLSLEHGLSQPSVMAICQDGLGRMWFGTREGINVFDGERVLSYKGMIGNVDNDSIWIGNFVSSVNSDSDGNIYFISDYNLFKYDIVEENFEQLTKNGSTSAMTESGGNIIYVQNNNIYELKHDKENQDKYEPDLLYELSMEYAINTIFKGQSKFYIGTSTGLIYYSEKDNGKFSTILSGEDIYSILETSNGEIWVGTRMNGLYIIKNDKIEKVPFSITGNNGTISLQIREFVEDDDKNIWFGTFLGLQKFDIKKQQFSAIKIPKYAGGLNHPSIFSMYRDREGNIWAGSYYGGVNYFNPTHSAFLHYDYQVGEMSNLYYSYIGEMVLDKRDNLWISTDGGGISCVDRSWNLLDVLIAGEGNSLPHNNVKSICYDEEHDMLYIGTHLGGLSRYDIKTGKFYNYLDKKGQENAPGNIIHRIRKWKNYIIVSCREGVFSLDTNTDLFTKLESFYGAPTIFDISPDGTFYSSYNDKILSISLDSSTKNTEIKLPDNVAVSQITATKSHIYICTLGFGMLVYSPSTKSLDSYKAPDLNILSNYCYDAKETSSGKILITSDKGIMLYNPSDKKIVSIDHNYLKAPIINGCGVLVDNNNDIFIGDTKGITYFRESDFYSSQEIPGEIYFSDIYINNEIVHPSHNGRILNKALAFTDKIVLDHSENNIVIEFASTKYADRHIQRSFMYKLEGLDKGWTTTNTPSARYTNLQPGDYTLYAKIADAPDSKVSVLDIHISTPWYNTWYAYLVYFIVVFTVVYMFVRNRIEHRNLEISLERERFEKKHIEELNHNKLVFFTNISHEFRTPLTLIISHIDSLLQIHSFPPTVYNKIMKLKHNAQYMNNLVSELLDFRKFTQNHYNLKVSQNDLCAFVKEIYLSFSDYALQKGINYEFNAFPESIVCWFDAKHLEKVFYNLLSNAFKYTQSGTIGVNIKLSDNKIFVTVYDTGCGISVKDAPRIFDRFYQVEDKKDDGGAFGTGIGLALTKSIVEKHHGTISVESKLGEGSSFIVSLPLERTEYIKDEHIQFIDKQPETPVLETVSSSSDYSQDNELPVASDNADKKIPSPEDNSLLKPKEDSEKYTILIVEDNKELIQILDDLFSPFYKVLKAYNGKEGLSMTFEYKPDIIVSDIMMPEMTGTELCIQIKNNIDLCHIPVVLLTALNSTEQNLEGFNRGADDYISKPFNSDLLLARVNNLVRNRLLIQSQINKKPLSDIDLASINPLDQDLLRKTSKVIEEHIDDPEFDVPELCKEIGIGRSLLYSKFKSLTGMTPNNFILNQRLKHAASLLQKYPTMPVAEISDRCGFSSPVYFSRCFKGQYGVTPQVYKKQQ